MSFREKRRETIDPAVLTDELAKAKYKRHLLQKQRESFREDDVDDVGSVTPGDILLVRKGSSIGSRARGRRAPSESGRSAASAGDLQRPSMSRRATIQRIQLEGEAPELQKLEEREVFRAKVQNLLAGDDEDYATPTQKRLQMAYDENRSLQKKLDEYQRELKRAVDQREEAVAKTKANKEFLSEELRRLEEEMGAELEGVEDRLQKANSRNEALKAALNNSRSETSTLKSEVRDWEILAQNSEEKVALADHAKKEAREEAHRYSQLADTLDRELQMQKRDAALCKDVLREVFMQQIEKEGEERDRKMAEFDDLVVRWGAEVAPEDIGGPLHEKAEAFAATNMSSISKIVGGDGGRGDFLNDLMELEYKSKFTRIQRIQAEKKLDHYRARLWVQFQSDDQTLKETMATMNVETEEELRRLKHTLAETEASLVASEMAAADAVRELHIVKEELHVVRRKHQNSEVDKEEVWSMARHEKEFLSQTLQSLEEQLKNKGREQNVLETEIRKVREDKAEALRIKDAEMHEKEREVEMLKSQLEAVKSENKEFFTNQLVDKEDEYRRLEEQSRFALEDKNSQLTERELILQRVREEHAKLQRDYAGLETELRETQLSLEKLAEEKDVLIAQTVDTERAVEAIDAAKGCLAEEKELAENKISELEESIRKLNEDVIAANRETKDKIAEVERLNKTIDYQEKQLNMAHATHNNLRNEIEQMDLRFSQSSNKTRQEYDVLLREAQLKWEEKQQPVYDELKDLKREVASKQQRIEELTTSLQVTTNRLSTAEEGAAKMSENLGNLQQELSEARMQYTQEAERRSQLEISHDNLQTDYHKVVNELQASRNEVASAVGDIEQKSQQINRMQEEREQMKKQLHDEMDELTAQVGIQVHDKNVLTEILDKERASKDEMKQLNETLQQSLRQVEDSRRSLEDKLTHVLREKELYSSDLQKLEGKLNVVDQDYTKERTQMNSDLARAQLEIEKLVSENRALRGELDMIQQLEAESERERREREHALTEEIRVASRLLEEKDKQEKMREEMERQHQARLVSRAAEFFSEAGKIPEATAMKLSNDSGAVVKEQGDLSARLKSIEKRLSAFQAGGDEMAYEIRGLERSLMS